MKITDITKNPPISGECRYRVAYRHQNWVGRPDPSGLGLSTLDYASPSGLADAIVSLTRKGHIVIGTWKWFGRWIRM